MSLLRPFEEELSALQREGGENKHLNESNVTIIFNRIERKERNGPFFLMCWFICSLTLLSDLARKFVYTMDY